MGHGEVGDQGPEALRLPLALCTFASNDADQRRGQRASVVTRPTGGGSLEAVRVLDPDRPLR